MCTSLVYRGNDTIIAMNYDNHGMNLRLEPYNKNHFIVTINSFGQNRPLFGIRRDGIFVNQQVINECKAGAFRIGYHVIHTANLVKKVLNDQIQIDKLDSYLDKHKIVSPPKMSIHAMIANAKGDSYIIEPGRGNVKYDKTERYFVMSNCSVYEAKQSGEWNGFGVDRQQKAEKMLEKSNENFNVDDAFEVLNAVHQTDELWNTEFSFVYSANENAVYYCYNHKFDQIQKYQM